MDKAGARKGNKIKKNKSTKQVMDIIYCSPLLFTPDKKTVQSPRRRRRRKAWFCLFFSAKCSVLNTDIPKRSPCPTTPNSRLEDHMPVPY